MGEDTARRGEGIAGVRKLLRHFPASVTYPVALALLACAEVLIRLGGLRENLSLALLLGVCTTLRSPSCSAPTGSCRHGPGPPWP
ncbi:hypothetical protein ACFWA5_13785 [Streptomyces mirabilis]|uniref:hypothetical protein n=1 Tax=Streptomyces mirabilis TaxID=68239 RepID=UPI00365CA172